jgi:hypothetical protein
MNKFNNNSQGSDSDSSRPNSLVNLPEPLPPGGWAQYRKYQRKVRINGSLLGLEWR